MYELEEGSFRLTLCVFIYDVEGGGCKGFRVERGMLKEI